LEVTHCRCGAGVVEKTRESSVSHTQEEPLPLLRGALRVLNEVRGRIIDILLPRVSRPRGTAPQWRPQDHARLSVTFSMPKSRDNVAEPLLKTRPHRHVAFADSRVSLVRMLIRL
jgi:hypothetical protein